MSRLLKIACYLLFTALSLHVFIAELVFFKYSLSGIWTARVIFLIWLAVTLFIILKNWKHTTAKVSFAILILAPIIGLMSSGVLARDILLLASNKHLDKRIDFASYSAFAKRSALIGNHVSLYKSNALIKEYISSKVEKDDIFKVKDADNAELLYEGKEKIIVKFFNRIHHKIVEFEKKR